MQRTVAAAGDDSEAGGSAEARELLLAALIAA